jgi:hypothetical protein
MKIEIEKETLKELSCIVQVVSILGQGIKISPELETAAKNALGELDAEIPDLDL